MKTHLAGKSITIGNAVIQRCSICGEILCDSRKSPFQSVPFPCFDEGKSVRVERDFQGRIVWWQILDHWEPLQEDSCFHQI